MDPVGVGSPLGAVTVTVPLTCAPSTTLWEEGVTVTVGVVFIGVA